MCCWNVKENLFYTCSLCRLRERLILQNWKSSVPGEQPFEHLPTLTPETMLKGLHTEGVISSQAGCM